MENKKAALIVAGGAAILYFLYRRSRKTVAVSVEQIQDEIPETGMNIPGYQGGDFISDIDVLVNPNLLGMLQHKMMPLYGFVGTTTIGVPVPVYLERPKSTRQFSVSRPGVGSMGGGSKVQIKAA
jgi:hypothetical protein